MDEDQERKNKPAKLQWPPTEEDLRRLYKDQKLSAMKISRPYGLKYPNPKSGESMVLYYLKRFRINRRDQAEHLRKVTEEMVDAWKTLNATLKAEKMRFLNEAERLLDTKARNKLDIRNKVYFESLGSK